MRAPLHVIAHPRYPAFRILLRAKEVRGFVVPRGFVWDGCSIPGIVRGVIGTPYDGPQRDAGLLHDYLYETWKVTRKDADELFYRQLLDDGASRAKAYLMWSAVRLFAAGHYKQSSDWPKFIEESELRKLEAHSEISVLPVLGW